MFEAPPVNTQLLEAIELAEHQTDPLSFFACAKLREYFDPQIAAEATTQIALRRKAQHKFANQAAQMLFTSAGLEQATRPAVAHWRAKLLLENGIKRVVDLGCGIATETRAFAEAGLEVVAIEIDQKSASYAKFNSPQAKVLVGDATQALESLDIDDQTAIFVDPARRNAKGRSWNIDDLSPSWSFVTSLFEKPNPICIKLGPGTPHRLIAPDLAAIWVSHEGDLVELGLWKIAGLQAGWKALLLPENQTLISSGRELESGSIGKYLYEPNAAVIRAQALADIHPDLWLLAKDIAYLTSDCLITSPFVDSFEVIEVIDYKLKILRAWVKTNQIGILEIKKRGVDVDPALLRKQLKPVGKNSATIVITPTISGVKAIVCERIRAKT